eukprot:6204433-Pleurochrysis_carterae.AAC.1
MSALVRSQARDAQRDAEEALRRAHISARAAPERAAPELQEIHRDRAFFMFDGLGLPCAMSPVGIEHAEAIGEVSLHESIYQLHKQRA